MRRQLSRIQMRVIGFMVFSFLVLVAADCAGLATKQKTAEPMKENDNYTSARVDSAARGSATAEYDTKNSKNFTTNSSDVEKQQVNSSDLNEEESDFETQDYGSYRPSPALKRPPPKLIPTR
eukprot:Gb_19712 [translate_table: standard]